ncbi:MAG: glutamate synthase subunit alpha [Clostridiales bacterium 43-6]|nr:MAG: glutamate synthase subunit alpha [Clostridiales bacterium 43-6]
MKNQVPQKQGLYNPEFEHDACGIGFVANIKGEKSNKILHQSLSVLKNLNHRGGVGSEPNSGDGAGILLQLPHAFFVKATDGSNISLPGEGDYGTGLISLPHDSEIRTKIEKILEDIVTAEGQTLLGWRDVPVDFTSLGKTAKDSMPYLRQIFIGRNGVEAGIAFERKLYIIRRMAELSIHKSFSNERFYVASLSSKTIVYKGMLTSDQVEEFYLDLQDEAVETALALVHSRYSTNTFPSWERAHPNRYIIHNGEINTLRGNVNFMNARESMFKTDAFGAELENVLPVIHPDGSDSAMFDNCVEFLMLSGMPLENVMMMMIPEPWANHESMSDDKKAFYEFNSCLMEPWDGPAAMGFTDGSRIGAVLDRNGLRPSRYYVTSDDLVVLSSEVGVLEFEPEKIIKKERLHPGRMLLIDTEKGEIISDEDLKTKTAAEHPYREWIKNNMVELKDLPDAGETIDSYDEFVKLQKAFGYTYEDMRMVLAPMAKDGVDPIGAMGNDAPLAVLSQKPQLLYSYFKQLFAQVTNPPIDALRETIVTSSIMLLGSEGNLLDPNPGSCRRVKIDSPIITNGDLKKLQTVSLPGLQSLTLPILFEAARDGKGMEEALETLFTTAENAVLDGTNLLILSDRGITETMAPIPAMLAVGGLHHHLIRKGIRTRASIVLESGEPREVHHFACLIGFGASAINPYLAMESIRNLIEDGTLENLSEKDAFYHYIKAANKGVIKILSKMGISTIQSYLGAQIFEAVGLDSAVIEKYFASTPSPVGGMGIDDVAKEALLRHNTAFSCLDDELESDGLYQYRTNGEQHLFNPETIGKLQQACREGDYKQFKEYSGMLYNDKMKLTLRGLMKFKKTQTPVSIDEVESVESICRRFKTGAMSFGSISREAHEALAIAMNRIGGKSNTGEGGEDPARFTPDENGDSRCSAIKQVASGRFGVTGEYLINAKEIQIKMAQGAKPGEGGQLPGRKVYPWVAKVRYSTPGVGLISPPPHHDIYSIEDLKELIYDLKNANPGARISVKLVSEAGVGTIAAGVAKGLADVILISGYDGGTGASPRTSIMHAGLPWELGLAETHQTLVLNDLRSRIVLETDGKLMTGRDVAVAALLGAEEFGFSTAPLVPLGCVMMRVCNLDTCPVGIATQNPKLRGKFAGDPQYVVNFMRFVASELREIMAELGFKTINEMVGRSDLLESDAENAHWKAKNIDLSSILYKPNANNDGLLCNTMKQDHELHKTLDNTTILPLCKNAVETGEKVVAEVKICNTDRAACTILSSEISKKYGSAGLPEDTITLNFTGTTGQSFGAFAPLGLTMKLRGDANDYVGKGMCGAKLMVSPPEGSGFAAEDNIIVGNVAFYGATKGEAYINGVAGERFCVRNSGVTAVVEGVGDHGCEYMTGGRVVVLGPTGRNFAAGMSGGVAYIYDEDGSFKTRLNTEMVALETLEEKHIAELKELIEKHSAYTGSKKAAGILASWEASLPKFVLVMPKDYKRMMISIEKALSDGYTGDDALMAAFGANNSDSSRVSGN